MQQSCTEFQISMNVPQALHAKTVVPAPTQMVHTVVFAQVDGETQTVPQVKKQSLFHLQTFRICNLQD